jgi:hypothetical protein
MSSAAPHSHHESATLQNGYYVGYAACDDEGHDGVEGNGVQRDLPSSFFPERGNGGHAGDVENREDHEYEYLSMRQDGRDICGAQCLVQHEQRKLLAENAQEQGDAGRLREPQDARCDGRQQGVHRFIQPNV